MVRVKQVMQTAQRQETYLTISDNFSSLKGAPTSYKALACPLSQGLEEAFWIFLACGGLLPTFASAGQHDDRLADIDDSLGGGLVAPSKTHSSSLVLQLVSLMTC